MAKKKKSDPGTAESTAKASASARIAAAAEKIKEKMPPKGEPKLSPLAQGNMPQDQPLSRQQDAAPGGVRPLAEAPAATKQPRISNPSKKKVKRDASPTQRASRALTTVSENKDILRLSSENVDRLTQEVFAGGSPSDQKGTKVGAAQTAEELAEYAKRVKGASSPNKNQVKVVRKKFVGPDLRITKTLDADTDKEIAEAALSGDNKGNQVVKAAIDDEMRWGGSDGESGSTYRGVVTNRDRPRTGRGGPGNPMYIRTGADAVRYGITTDQKMFTPTVDEIVAGARIAKKESQVRENDNEAASERYHTERKQLESALETAEHPDDQESYKDAIQRLDADNAARASGSRRAAREVSVRGSIVVRPAGAPDTKIGKGWEQSYDRARRTTKTPLSIGQHVRTGVAIEAKRDRINEMIREVPLGAPRGDTQPDVRQGRTASLGGALIKHDSVSIVRKKVPNALSPEQKQRRNTAINERNALVRMGKNVPADKVGRIDELKDVIDNLNADGSYITAGELESRKGVSITYDAPVAVRHALTKAEGVDEAPVSGYAASAIEQARQAIDQNIPKPQAPAIPTTKEDVYTDRRGNMGKAPRRGNFNTPGLTTQARPTSSTPVNAAVTRDATPQDQDQQEQTVKRTEIARSRVAASISAEGAAGNRLSTGVTRVTPPVTSEPRQRQSVVKGSLKLAKGPGKTSEWESAMETINANNTAVAQRHADRKAAMAGAVRAGAASAARVNLHQEWLGAGASPEVAAKWSDIGQSVEEAKHRWRQVGGGSISESQIHNAVVNKGAHVSDDIWQQHQERSAVSGTVRNNSERIAAGVAAADRADSARREAFKASRPLPTRRGIEPPGRPAVSGSLTAPSEYEIVKLPEGNKRFVSYRTRQEKNYLINRPSPAPLPPSK